MVTCLVTGGAGFLGSHLCDELLRRGHGVICIDNQPDISLAREVLGWEPKVVLHDGLGCTIEESGIEALIGAGAR